MRGKRAALIAALVIVSAGLGLSGAGALAPSGAGPADGGDVPIGAVPPAPSSPPAEGQTPVAPTTAAGEELVGLFSITAGACTSAPVPTGSWFRMVQPGGNAESGPFVDNNDSPCADKSATTLQPGRDGGLVTRQHQPAPDPAFDSSGNGIADRVVKPQRFYGVGFAAATNPTDPQTATKVAAPVLHHDDGKLSGDLRSFGVAWNRQHFNQGAPKPNGSLPGQTKAPRGTYDPSTGAFVLEWSSQIEGGPFNGFTGVWHLEGTFRPSSVSASGGAGADQGAASTRQTGGAVLGATTGAAAAAPAGVAGTHPRTGGAVPWAATAVLGVAVLARVVQRVRA